jgi:hypothetical protein
MPLLNYTTAIDALKSAGEIEYTLIKHGARSVMKNIGESGRIEAMSFMIPGQFGNLPIRLPVNIKPVYEVLKQQKAKGAKSINLTTEQAERVAWRILKDWTEAQMAILETGMVKLEQVFLPYITNAAGQTFYDLMEQKQFMLGDGRQQP